MKTEELPEGLIEATRYFSDEKRCHDFMVEMRWPHGVQCPRCSSKNIGALVESRRIWNCKGCKKQFSAKVGTIFEDSPLSLTKWLPATWLIVNAKNGISSCELHRALSVTQKTAWFMLHRIRLAMQEGSFDKFSGRVEADETYIGAKARNMHADKRRQKGTGTLSKTAVLGLLQRQTEAKPSRVRLKVMRGIKVRDLDPEVRANVEAGAELLTDSHPSYYKLGNEYVHQVIDHAISYANGHVHTNCLENSWSLLKRALKGTYVNVEPFHLFRYLDEQAFRYNERKHEDGDRGRFMDIVRSVAGKRLTYNKLIDLDGKKSGGLPPQTAGAW
jgi:transposase-like protein/5-methylcytosine-specific restriction endonuclease McrA